MCVTEWVKSSERLPEKDAYYLVAEQTLYGADFAVWAFHPPTECWFGEEHVMTCPRYWAEIPPLPLEMED